MDNNAKLGPGTHVKCPRCHHEVECGDATEEIECPNCRYKSNFYPCRFCGSPVVLGKGLGSFRCPWCGVENKPSRSDRVAARTIRAHLAARGIDDYDPNRHLIGGLVLCGGEEVSLPIGTVCSVVFLSHDVIVTAESTNLPPVVLSLPDVVRLATTAHGAVKGNGEFIGREFESLRSGTDSVLISRALSRIRSRPSIGSLLELETTNQSFRFATNLYTPAELSVLLGPIQMLIQAADSPPLGSDAVDSRPGLTAGSREAGSTLTRPMIGAAIPNTPGPDPVRSSSPASEAGVRQEDRDADLAEQLEALSRLHESHRLNDTDFEVSRARLLEAWIRHHPQS